MKKRECGGDCDSCPGCRGGTICPGGYTPNGSRAEDIEVLRGYLAEKCDTQQMVADMYNYYGEATIDQCGPIFQMVSYLSEITGNLQLSIDSRDLGMIAGRIVGASDEEITAAVASLSTRTTRPRSMRDRIGDRTMPIRSESPKLPLCPVCGTRTDAQDMKYNGMDDDGCLFEYYICPGCGKGFTITYEGADEGFDYWYDSYEDEEVRSRNKIIIGVRKRKAARAMISSVRSGKHPEPRKASKRRSPRRGMTL